MADYPEARASLTERGCQLLRKDGLLDEAVFASKLELLKKKASLLVQVLLIFEVKWNKITFKFVF